MLSSDVRVTEAAFDALMVVDLAGAGRVEQHVHDVDRGAHGVRDGQAGIENELVERVEAAGGLPHVGARVQTVRASGAQHGRSLSDRTLDLRSLS
jgi:hypothetical protein